MTSQGLSAAELTRVVAELQALVGSEVADVAPLQGNDDLLVVLQDGERRRRLHLAPGGSRARVTTTTRRFGRHDFATGPKTDFLRRALTGTRLAAVTQPPGERCCTMAFAGRDSEHHLHVELFGPRGLWCLTDAGGTVLEMSRPLRTKARTLAIGDRYAPPPPAPVGDIERESRFAPPVLEAVDEHFTARDLADTDARERTELERVLQRALRRCRAKLAGLERQQQEAAGAQRLRADADLLLAYAHQVPRGATEISVPDPHHDGESRILTLKPDRPPRDQAQAWYKRARSLEDGLAVARRRQAEAATELEALGALVDEADLEKMRTRLQELGHLPGPAPPRQKLRKERKATSGEEFRRFDSAEGYPILVGRNNAQNDRLTLRVARGNDVWLHVGGGRAGSHVVIRLPRGKSASLETLLDAGTLAVHFSKARGETLCDVIYTQAKHVRKPKGMPAGRVVPSKTKTITVRRDEVRLQRLLGGAGAE